ncbi:MAG: tRNA (adenosine(37)-N6)-threonylcarbamoyltransferase complex transferase subunit TsaD [bacterium]
MRVLGIETSCDESAISLVTTESGRVRVLKSLVSSQIEIHKKYGGVVPEVAARQHVQVLAALMRESGITSSDVDTIAVTSGPGLVTALRVGIDFAKALAWAWKKPLVGVNHIEGHIYANWITREISVPAPSFPALCLIVSGGHTELLLMRGHGIYERLGETLDDAVGEAFDKTAKLLGLPYPGGPQISKLAESGNSARYDFPRPMMGEPGLDFSYSGLKTSVRVTVQEIKKTTNQEITGIMLPDLCASFQAAAIEPLVKKTERALRAHEEIECLTLAGGVSANKLLRGELAQLSAEYQLPLFMPDLQFTGDNAAMIAAAGCFRAEEASLEAWKNVTANPGSRLGV